MHRELGPGLLESVYNKCLRREFELGGIPFSFEHLVPVSYKGIELNTELRVDFFIEEIFVLELKAVDVILPIHEAQILTYMKLLKSPKGLLINFNCTNIYHNGRKPFVNELYRDLV